MPLVDAIAVAGGGEAGRRLITRLADERARDGSHSGGPLRLITVTEEGSDEANVGGGRWVNLIHETLIRSKGPGAAGKPQPYWPTLWAYIENNKQRAARRERLQLMAREWKDRTRLARLSGLARWSSLFGFRGLSAPGSIEQRYLRWSRGRAGVEAIVLTAVLGVVGESMHWARIEHGLPYQALEARWLHILGIKKLPLPTLVDLSPGTFMMGSNRHERENEQPVHPVTIREPLSIGATEVTFEEYDAFCDATGRAPPNDAGWARGNHPVIYVDWSDARAYAKWLNAMTGWGCRLPSEAEWEYAARAGTTTEYALPAPDGSDDIAGKNFANCADCGSEWDSKQTAPAASFKPHAWDLHDMHGNVWEWVEDCWHDSYKGAPEDGSAWLETDGGHCGLRVLRGGSWSSYRGGARAASRVRYDPFYRDRRDDSLGFRVVCSSPSSEH